MLGYLLKSRRLRAGMEQRELCAGICSVSYLSKIENDQAAAGEDVLRLLFGRLGIADWSARTADDPAATLLRDYFTCRLMEEDASAPRDALRRILPSLDGTTLELPGRIFTLYDTADKAEVLRQLADIAPFRAYLTPAQTMLLNHITWGWTEADSIDLLAASEACYPCCITALDMANDHFLAGRWQESLQWARTAFDRAVAVGCVHVMTEAMLTEGGCYANLYNIPLMLAAYDRAAALSRGRDNIRRDVAYNVGATLLEVGRDRDALPHLLLAYERTEPDIRLMTCHKLALCCQRLHRHADADRYLTEAEALCRSLNDPDYTSLIALMRRRCTPGYLDDPEYGTMLRAFCDGSRFPRGYIVFHERLLEEWLTHQRRYKEAYELLKHRFPDTQS